MRILNEIAEPPLRSCCYLLPSAFYRLYILPIPPFLSPTTSSVLELCLSSPGLRISLCTTALSISAKLINHGEHSWRFCKSEWWHVGKAAPTRMPQAIPAVKRWSWKGSSLWRWRRVVNAMAPARHPVTNTAGEGSRREDGSWNKWQYCLLGTGVSIEQDGSRARLAHLIGYCWYVGVLCRLAFHISL